MTSLYLLPYRIYFALQELGGVLALRWLPGPARQAKRVLHRVLRRFVLPKLQRVVRVQSGLSRGLRIWARLPEEAGYWRGRHERGTQESIARVVREGAVVYDVGAHLGIIALGAARVVGETGRIVAFDGDPDNAAILRRNCLLNGFESRIQVVHAAVWSYTSKDGIPFRPGEVRRSHGRVEAGGRRPAPAAGGTINVPAITLDDFIASGQPVPALVKIDVEGGEYEVLRGAEKLLSDSRPLLIVEVHHQRALQQVTGWLDRFRYCAKWEIPVQGFPRILFAWPAEHNRAPFG